LVTILALTPDATGASAGSTLTSPTRARIGVATARVVTYRSPLARGVSDDDRASPLVPAPSIVPHEAEPGDCGERQHCNAGRGR